MTRLQRIAQIAFTIENSYAWPLDRTTADSRQRVRQLAAKIVDLLDENRRRAD